MQFNLFFSIKLEFVDCCDANIVWSRIVTPIIELMYKLLMLWQSLLSR